MFYYFHLLLITEFMELNVNILHVCVYTCIVGGVHENVFGEKTRKFEYFLLPSRHNLGQPWVKG